MVAKSYPRKQVCSQNFHRQIFWPKFFMAAISFPRKQVPINNCRQKCFGRNFVMVAKPFTRKKWALKIFVKNIFLSKFPMVAKPFHGKQVPTKIFLKTFLWTQIISSKTGNYKKFSTKIILSKSLRLQNHFFGNWFLSTIVGENFKWKIFYS